MANIHFTFGWLFCFDHVIDFPTGKVFSKGSKEIPLENSQPLREIISGLGSEEEEELFKERHFLVVSPLEMAIFLINGEFPINLLVDMLDYKDRFTVLPNIIHPYNSRTFSMVISRKVPNKRVATMDHILAVTR